LFLKAKIKNVSEWKAVLNAIDEIVEEAMFICNTDEITFRGMDQTHVSLLNITFPKSSFEEFESTTTFFGVRTSEIKNIFSSASDNDIVELQIDNEENLRVLINGTLNMVFTLKLLEKTETNTPVPKVKSNSKITLTPATLTRIITNLEKVSEYVTIKSLSNRVEFSGSGDIGDARIDLLKSNPDLKKLEITDDTVSVYSLEYVGKIIRSIGRASKNLNMQYSTESPLYLEFDMPSMIKVGYYLAPRTRT
jgi:proliferating cell nuclear antigen